HAPHPTRPYPLSLPAALPISCLTREASPPPPWPPAGGSTSPPPTTTSSGPTGRCTAWTTRAARSSDLPRRQEAQAGFLVPGAGRDRKSTRLNSSHDQISYAVF